MAEWLTYEELASRLEIRFEAARQRANRAGWPKQRRPDGKTVVQYAGGPDGSPIPNPTAALDAQEVILSSIVNVDTLERIESLEAENAALRQEIAAKEEQTNRPIDDTPGTSRTASRSTKDVTLIARNRYLEVAIEAQKASGQRDAARADKAEGDWASCAIELRDTHEEMDRLKNRLERAIQHGQALEAEHAHRLDEIERKYVEELTRCEAYAELGPIRRFFTPAPAVSVAKFAFRPSVRAPTGGSV